MFGQPKDPPMKTLPALLAFGLLFSSISSSAQLKSTPVCGTFTVDILEGSVNHIKAESPFEDIKQKLPCFTEAVSELNASGCGGVYYKDKGVYFYTYRDYIDIRDNFNGNISIPLLGAERNNLFKWLGHPQRKDFAWEVYQMRYGIVVLYFDTTGKVNRIIISTRSADNLRLCDQE